MNADPTPPSPEDPPALGARGQPEFFRRFARLAGGYWRSERRRTAAWLTLAVVVLTVAQVATPVAINLWSERLFDALEQRAMAEFLALVGVLVLIMLANMAIVTTHLWVKRRLQVDWRDWLTRQLVDGWMRAGRHYQLTLIPGDHDNPDGRIAEDARIATEYAVDLAHSLFYCLLLLVSFTHILWGISGSPEIEVWGVGLYVPGHLVWVALVYAAVGTGATILLGRPLVRAANRRQVEEASFRFGLARSRENALPIALLQSEASERRGLGDLFRQAVLAWERQTRALRDLYLFSSSWSVLSQVFPVLVAAPRYIAGTITLGTLMQSAQAFQQMVSALAWPIDNLPRLAEWQASAGRVLGLHGALAQLGEQVVHSEAGAIVREPAAGPGLAFRGLGVTRPTGEVLVDNLSAEIRPGEHVLVTGDPDTASTLVQVVAGLWPWGRGRVELPEGVAMFFLPRRPYLPTGTLRAALTYPRDAEPPPDAAIEGALRRVGLARLTGRLGERANWDEVLSAGEKQRIGFARLLLRRPRWIFIQEATEDLEPEAEREMMDLLKDEFPGAAVISIGRRDTLGAYHRRQLVPAPPPAADASP
jgi:putative ATP-binding cassette transporter